MDASEIGIYTASDSWKFLSDLHECLDKGNFKKIPKITSSVNFFSLGQAQSDRAGFHLCLRKRHSSYSSHFFANIIIKRFAESIV